MLDDIRSGRDASSLSGATAGVVAAVVWAAGEPVLQRLARTPYSDVRLLGRFVTRGRAWPIAGLALHLANGALFGAAFERTGFRGRTAGLLAAQIENAALWPAMAIVDRVHPDRIEGTWPPLVRNPQVAVQEIAAHAIFGVVLGTLLSR